MRAFWAREVAQAAQEERRAQAQEAHDLRGWEQPRDGDIVYASNEVSVGKKVDVRRGRGKRVSVWGNERIG